MLECMQVHCWIGDFGSPRLAELCYESLPEEWPNTKCTPKHPCTLMHSQRTDCFDVWQVSVETELGFVWPPGLLLSLWHHPLVIHTSVNSKEAETGEDLSSKNSCVPQTHSLTSLPLCRTALFILTFTNCALTQLVID